MSIAVAAGLDGYTACMMEYYLVAIDHMIVLIGYRSLSDRYTDVSKY
ncbi:hypothetical protein [Persicobacter diffluens]